MKKNPVLDPDENRDRKNRMYVCVCVCACVLFSFFFPVALQPNAGHSLLILEDPRSHNDTPQSVGLLWTSHQLVAET